MNLTHIHVSALAAASLVLGACGGKKDSSRSTDAHGGAGAGAGDKDLPVFSLAWSEYPSWSVFGVADELGLLDKEEGKLGSIEKKWGVDIELKEADYDACLTMFGAGQCDAACLTNMDSLAPALGRDAVAILPTSTSFGADACLVTEAVTSIQDLKGRKTYGLEATVSQYVFARNLELAGEKEVEYDFANMDPGAAALALQQKQEGYDSVVVWNPFVLETLKRRDDVRVLFDSTTIPGEIIDMVTASQASLAKPGGEAFACAVIDAYFEVNKRLADPATADDTLVAIGEKFSSLELESMKKVVEQTQFYGTPDSALAAFETTRLKPIMEKVTAFCVSHDIIEKTPVIVYGEGEGEGDLIFDSSYLQKVKAK